MRKHYLSQFLSLFMLLSPFFSGSEEKQKSIDIESICQLLDLVLGSHFQAQVDYFIEYLKVSWPHFSFVFSEIC
jgi:hypothetical protein